MDISQRFSKSSSNREKMICVREVQSKEKKLIDDIVTIHLETFPGFFLTFMGRGFLNQMYRSYCDHRDSGLFVAEENGKTVGFLAYSMDFSNLYKYMIKTRLIPFGIYSVGALFRRPGAFLHIIRAFLKPSEAKRKEKYVELSSIGVKPFSKNEGIGSLLIEKLKSLVNFDEFAYITLETDAENNDVAIHFYEKNCFVCERTYVTEEGRKMLEYRFSGRK